MFLSYYCHESAFQSFNLLFKLKDFNRTKKIKFELTVGFRIFYLYICTHSICDFVFSNFLKSIFIIYSHCVPLSHQQRYAFTPHLPSLSFAWMHFNPWLVLTYHYGWWRKRGLLKWMVSKLFAFWSIKKSLEGAFVLTSTSWHLYHIVVHGSFWGCLLQMYQAVSE